MYREKVQELQSEIINLIYQKATAILKDKESSILLPSAFRLDRTHNGYEGEYYTESLSITSLGKSDSSDRVCFITDSSQYINLGEADIYQLAWVLDQFLSKKTRVENIEYPF